MQHNRKMLFVFEEFDKFGYFPLAEDLINFKRASGVKGVFVVQNLDQIIENYPNEKNFFTNCDIQIIALSNTDNTGARMVSEAMGGYVEHGQQGREHQRKVLTEQEAREMFSEDGHLQCLISQNSSKVMKLTKIKGLKLFPWTKRSR